jgi:hypothetical protein
VTSLGPDILLGNSATEEGETYSRNQTVLLNNGCDKYGNFLNYLLPYRLNGEMNDVNFSIREFRWADILVIFCQL